PAIRRSDRPLPKWIRSSPFWHSRRQLPAWPQRVARRWLSCRYRRRGGRGGIDSSQHERATAGQPDLAIHLFSTDLHLTIEGATRQLEAKNIASYRAGDGPRTESGRKKCRRSTTCWESHESLDHRSLLLHLEQGVRWHPGASARSTH